MSTKSGLKTCFKTLLECFALEHDASKAKYFRSVLGHVLRLDFVDIFQLLVQFLIPKTFFKFWPKCACLPMALIYRETSPQDLYIMTLSKNEYQHMWPIDIDPSNFLQNVMKGQNDNLQKKRIRHLHDAFFCPVKINVVSRFKHLLKSIMYNYKNEHNW